MVSQPVCRAPAGLPDLARRDSEGAARWAGLESWSRAGTHPDARPQPFPDPHKDDGLAALFKEPEKTRAPWILRTPAWQERWERIAALHDGGPPTGGRRPHFIKREYVGDPPAEIAAAISMAPPDEEPPGLDMTGEIINVLR